MSIGEHQQYATWFTLRLLTPYFDYIQIFDISNPSLFCFHIRYTSLNYFLVVIVSSCGLVLMTFLFEYWQQIIFWLLVMAFRHVNSMGIAELQQGATWFALPIL